MLRLVTAAHSRQSIRGDCSSLECCPLPWEAGKMKSLWEHILGHDAVYLHEMPSKVRLPRPLLEPWCWDICVRENIGLRRVSARHYSPSNGLCGLCCSGNARAGKHKAFLQLGAQWVIEILHCGHVPNQRKLQQHSLTQKNPTLLNTPNNLKTTYLAP